MNEIITSQNITATPGYNNNSMKQKNNEKKDQQQPEDKNNNMKEKSVIILGDSIVKHINGWEISERLPKIELK